MKQLTMLFITMLTSEECKSYTSLTGMFEMWSWGDGTDMHYDITLDPANTATQQIFEICFTNLCNGDTIHWDTSTNTVIDTFYDGPGYLTDTTTQDITVVSQTATTLHVKKPYTTTDGSDEDEQLSDTMEILGGIYHKAMTTVPLDNSSVDEDWADTTIRINLECIGVEIQDDECSAEGTMTNTLVTPNEEFTMTYQLQTLDDGSELEVFKIKSNNTDASVYTSIVDDSLHIKWTDAAGTLHDGFEIGHDTWELQPTDLNAHPTDPTIVAVASTSSFSLLVENWVDKTYIVGRKLPLADPTVDVKFPETGEYSYEFTASTTLADFVTADPLVQSCPLDEEDMRALLLIVAAAAGTGCVLYLLICFCCCCCCGKSKRVRGDSSSSRKKKKKKKKSSS